MDKLPKIDRKEFFQVSAGLIGGLSIPGLLGETGYGASAREGETTGLDESYLEKGLTAMAQAIAQEKGWFLAHWGAAVISAYYLCQENPLDEETISGIGKQLDSLIGLNAEQFSPLPEASPNEKLIEKIPAALEPAVAGGLRAHGHAVIYASLSVKALRDVPHMAQPMLIEKLCGLSRQIARKKPEAPANPEPYADSQEMIEATFDSFTRFEPLLGFPSVKRPNFTHMTTHTEALMNLEQMEYGDVSRAGQLGHRAHIGAPVPEFDPAAETRVETPASLEDIVSPGYWENEANIDLWNKKWGVDENPNGYWVAFGHLFKVLYAYHRLVRRVEDGEKVRLCSRILLERYFNPQVDGG